LHWEELERVPEKALGPSLSHQLSWLSGNDVFPTTDQLACDIKVAQSVISATSAQMMRSLSYQWLR
jgi:hypothetical protein